MQAKLRRLLSTFRFCGYGNLACRAVLPVRLCSLAPRGRVVGALARFKPQARRPGTLSQTTAVWCVPGFWLCTSNSSPVTRVGSQQTPRGTDMHAAAALQG